MTKKTNMGAVPAVLTARAAMVPQRRRFLAGFLSLPILKFLPGAAGLQTRSGWVLHQDDI